MHLVLVHMYAFWGSNTNKEYYINITICFPRREIYILLRNQIYKTKQYYIALYGGHMTLLSFAVIIEFHTT